MKLTIVTPSYNQGSFIAQTFDTIVQQPHQFPIEYLIYDAVSKDNTENIINSYLPKFTAAKINYQYIRESDRGQSDAINKGWRKASGDIITYLNSDDYYEPDVLNTVMQFFDNHPNIQWAYGGWNLVNHVGIIFHTVQPKEFSKAKLLNYCNIGQPSCFFRRNLLDEFGMLNEKLHLAMDYDLWLRFATKYPAGIIPRILSNMRYHTDAKSSSQTTKQLWEVYRVGANYTKLLSWRRFAQIFYLCRGLISVTLKLNTISRKM